MRMMNWNAVAFLEVVQQVAVGETENCVMIRNFGR